MDNIRGPFYDDILTGLQLTPAKGALFFSVTSFMGFITCNFTPFLLRRYSVLNVLRAALLLMFIGFFGYGFVENLSDMIICSFIYGSGFGINSVVHNYAIQVGAAPKARKKLFSGLHANFAFASIIAPLIASFLSGYSWNKVFMVFALLPLVAFIATFMAKDRPKVEESSLKPVFSKRLYLHALFFALLFSLYLWGELSVATRLVLYLKTSAEYSHQEANLFLTLFFVGLFVGRLITTKYQPPLSTLWFLIICLFVSALSYYLGLVLSPLWICASGLFMAPCFPLYMEYLSQKFGALSGSAMALSMAISSLGIVVMHSVIGALSEEYSLKTALYVGPAALTVLALGLVIHRIIFKDKDLV